MLKLNNFQIIQDKGILRARQMLCMKRAF